MSLFDQKHPTKKIAEYYDDVGTDYRTWSRSLNLHLGYYRQGMNPFNLEAMLTQMNEEVLQRLKILRDERAVIIDTGCGVGESLRYLARRLPLTRLYGVNISSWQVAFGKKINHEKGFDKQVEMLQADFQDMPLPNSFADAVYAIESVCYASGRDKAALIHEMARVLKPGGRLVVVDGFRKNSGQFPLQFENFYRKTLDAWAIAELPEIANFGKTLHQAGFENLVIEDIGWQVMPSVLHVPVTIFKLCFKFIFGNASPGSGRYLKALLRSTVMGLWQGAFGYYMVSVSKSK